MGGRVIGLGQPAAGDDGVGLFVLAAARAMGAPAGVAFLEAGDASALLDLLRTPDRVVIVDAMLAVPGRAAPGEVVALDPSALAARGLAPVSSHGLSVGEAVALARAVWAEAISPAIRVVAIAIARPDRIGRGLSEVVAAAVPRAAALALSFVG